MTHTGGTSANMPHALIVVAGEDRFGEHRGLGISTIDFKVVPQDSSGLSYWRIRSMPGAARLDTSTMTS